MTGARDDLYYREIIVRKDETILSQRERLADLRDERHMATGRSDSIATALDKLSEIIKLQSRAIDDIKIAIRGIQTENGKNHADIDRISTEIRDTTAKVIKTDEEKIAHISSSLSSLNSTLMDIPEKIATVVQEIKTLHQIQNDRIASIDENGKQIKEHMVQHRDLEDYKKSIINLKADIMELRREQEIIKSRSHTSTVDTSITPTFGAPPTFSASSRIPADTSLFGESHPTSMTSGFGGAHPTTHTSLFEGAHVTTHTHMTAPREVSGDIHTASNTEH